MKFKGKNILLCPAVKYSSFGFDDMKSAVIAAEEINADCIYLLFSSLDRKALTLQEYTSVPVKVLPFKKFAKYLFSKGFTIPHKNTKVTFKKLASFFGGILNPHTAQRLIFSSVITVLLSFITPLKKYYLAVGFLQLVIAFACLFFPKGKTDTDILK